MWNNIVESDSLQTTLWRMRIARWISKAANTDADYVILIAFALQKSSHGRASMLRHMYVACPVNNEKS